MNQSLKELTVAHQGLFDEARGLALGFGDFAAEVEAIESGLGVLPLGDNGTLLARGPDAAVFLNGITTNDVLALGVGQAHRSLFCANKGKILFHAIVARTKEQEFLILTGADTRDAVAGHLDFYHIREELQMGNVGLARLDLLGPRAEAALAALELPPATVAGSFRDAPLVILPNNRGGKRRTVALLPPAAAAWLVEALLGTEPTARLVGLEACEEARLWAGIPRFGVDFDRDHLPAEAAVYDHISFNKGCYVGQEIHARMHHRGHPNRKLVAVEMPAALAAGLAAGAPLYRDGAAVGSITGLARAARGGRCRGIAMVRHAVVLAGGALAIAPEGPAEVAVQPVATDLSAPKS